MQTSLFRPFLGPVVACLLALAPAASAQTPTATLGSAPLTRVGVVVRDIQKAVKTYVDIFQLASAPAISTVKVDLAKGSMKVKRATVQLPNVRIEIDQPQGSSGPAAAYLKQFGQGIYRVGFSTPDALAARVAALEQKGGTLVAGKATGTFAWVDMTPSLGTILDMVHEAPPPPRRRRPR